MLRAWCLVRGCLFVGVGIEAVPAQGGSVENVYGRTMLHVLSRTLYGAAWHARPYRRVVACCTGVQLAVRGRAGRMGRAGSACSTVLSGCSGARSSSTVTDGLELDEHPERIRNFSIIVRVATRAFVDLVGHKTDRGVIDGVLHSDADPT